MKKNSMLTIVLVAAVAFLIGCSSSTLTETMEEASTEAASTEEVTTEEETTEPETEDTIDEEAAAEEAQFLADLEDKSETLYRGYQDVLEMLSYSYTTLDVLEENYDVEEIPDNESFLNTYVSVRKDLFGLSGYYLFGVSKLGDDGISAIYFVLDDADDFDVLTEDLAEMLGDDYSDISDDNGEEYWWTAGVHISDFDVTNKKYDDGSGVTGIFFITNSDYDSNNPDFSFAG